MFDGSARKAIANIARGLGVEPAALLAVAEIESGGHPFALVNGKPMPLIRWEGHYFYRLLPANLKQKGLEARLAHPAAGSVPNPASQQARYEMLARARKIHDEAALSSCSWGLGQVMGSHWKNLGFSSAEHMVKVACSGVPGQVELMARFIKKNELSGSLRRKDWANFARAYNGPAYKSNRYDVKMAGAYKRYLKNAPPGRRSGGSLFEAPPIGAFVNPSASSSIAPEPAQAESVVHLRTGSSGQKVRELQEALRRAGYFVYVDGNYGAATRKAVAEFQRKNGIKEDGFVGDQTRAALIKSTGANAAPWWSKREKTPSWTPWATQS